MAVSTRTRRSPPRSGPEAPLFAFPRTDPTPGGFERLRSGILALVVMALLAGVIAPLFLPLGLGAGKVADAYADFQVPKARPELQTSYVYDSAGNLLTPLHGEVDRTPISLKDVPVHLRRAVIVTEDKDFYSHPGVSLTAIIRAAYANVSRGVVWQGGSTLTEQYVKNVFGDPNNRTVLQKIQEAVLATKLENRLTKDQILERYLNNIYWGQGAYGIFAAAKTYFDKEPGDLTLLESALLAGIISRPGEYNPLTNPAAALYRRNFVLDRLVETGDLDAARAEKLKRMDLGLDPGGAKRVPAAYFVTTAKKWLEEEFGVETTFSGGLQVTTTIDMAMQRAAEQAVASWLPAGPDQPAAAMVVMDPTNGAIRAMVGDSRHLGRSRIGLINLATQAHRQTGSAFKPFTLAAAMEDRISLQSTWEGPSTLEIQDPSCSTYKPETNSWETWKPVNAGDSGVGRMTLLSATHYSVNTIFAQVVLEVGPADVAEIAKRMGIQSPLQPICSITLGANDVTVLDMTTAYATLAARGVRHWPRTVAKVTDADGNVLVRPRAQGEQVLNQNDADLVTYALQGVVQRGTGTRANIGRPVAGKTGSGEKNTNAYFCGYIVQLVACVWAGFPKGLIPMDRHFYGGPVYGGTIPALIWHDFMVQATQGMPVLSFPTPSFSGYDVYPRGSGVPVSSPSPEESPGEESPGEDGGSPSPKATRTKPPRPSPRPSEQGGGGGGDDPGGGGEGDAAPWVALGVLGPVSALAGGLRRRSLRGGPRRGS